MLLRYDEVKEHLQTRLCNPKRNTELLKNLVTTDYGIYTAYYAILLDEDSSESATTSVLISKDLLRYLDVTKEQLILDAQKADLCRGVYVFRILEATIRNPMKYDESINLIGTHIDISKDPISALVLTNKTINYGASLSIQPPVRYMIGEIFGCDFYLILSSIHDNIIIPDTGIIEGQDLLEIVHSVNINPEAISPEDVLSDDILWCSRNGDKVIHIKHKEEE